jgi:glucose/mannose-6-phosphate isomerase
MSKNILDNSEGIKKLDKQNMLGSLQYLGKQVEQIWEEAEQVKIPASYKQINNILVLGMGGSALGAHVFKTLFKDELKVPVEIINDYNIPNFLNNKTLVIASSYSGTTEEVLNSVKQAKKRKAKIISISSGNKLGNWAKKNKLPSLIFSTENNPSGQPRMGLGYSIIGQLILLSRVGLLKIDKTKIKQIIKTISYYDTIFGALTPTDENLAKQLSLFTNGSSIWYTASEHLSGNAHIGANQMNENAKRFAGYCYIPEINHHLMEGMRFPDVNKSNLLFVLIESDLYHKRNQKRYKVTKKVLDKNKIHYFSYQTKEKNKLLQMCEVLVFSSYVSYYSAILQGIDPSPIPFVDYFKEQMK